MRPVLHGDLITAARALEALAPPVRAQAAKAWLREAHAADLYRKRLGRVHPRWGNGSLMGRVIGEPCRPDGPIGAAYLQALSLLIAALGAWRGRN